MPSSAASPSPESSTPGLTASPNSVHGQSTPTAVPGPGVSMLPLSSVARVRIVVVGAPWAIQVYDQALVPVAGCHVSPPSVETSTPATTPPPVSAAVPVTVTDWVGSSCVDGVGDVIVEVGGVVSVDFAAVT